MADPQKIFEIIRRREDIVTGAADDFIAALEKAQNELLEDILAYTRKMKSSGRSIDNAPENVRLAVAMRDNIIKWLRKHGYYAAITHFGKQYEGLIRESRKYYAAMDANPIFARRDLDALSKFKQDDLAFMLNNDKRVTNLLYNELLDSVHQQRTWRDLAERLENLLTDTKKDDKVLAGLLKKYNRTYAQTAIATFDRRIQQIKTEDLQIDRFIFSGGVLKDSRKFCVDRVGKVFTKKQVKSWNGLSWRGKMPNCDIFICLGGYNCTHILNPTMMNDREIEELKALYN